ncbi:MAG: translation initiation factor IF-2, partial [bacterium]
MEAPKKIFQIAKDLNISSDTIINFLKNMGVNVQGGPNYRVSQEEYSKIIQKFGADTLKGGKISSPGSISGKGQEKTTQSIREDFIKQIQKAGTTTTPQPPKTISTSVDVTKTAVSIPIPATSSTSTADLQPVTKVDGPPRSPSEIEIPSYPSPEATLTGEKTIEKKVETFTPQAPPKGAPTPPVKPKPKKRVEPTKLAIPIALLAPTPKIKPKVEVEDLKPESVVDELETQVERTEIKELPKMVKTKIAAKPLEVVPAKKKKKEKELPIEKVKPKRVDDKEVSATIKKTLAAMEDHSKKRYKRDKAASEMGGGEEFARLRVSEFITTAELANLMEVPVAEVIKKAMKMGMLISINQRLDRDQIELIAADFEVEVEFITEEEFTELETEIRPENLQPRQPVVTVMGHVDHGKTTLLDYLRRTRVAESEAGGITQHIGAYEVDYKDNRITFLDTPGHEAFTAMRARGAQVTDIVVLVVAADDRVMPQTIEAIDHARAAGVPIIVAVNKIDKPNANPDAIYQQLSEVGVLVEKWGGKYQSAEISAKYGIGIDDLLAEILVAAELLDLKADPTVPARGVVVESRLDKGLGPVATILIQAGTLKVGDPFVCGQQSGRVRMLLNEKGESIPQVTPGKPAQVVGFDGVPQAGDKLSAVASEKEAKAIALKRQAQYRETAMRQLRSLTLNQMAKKLAEKEIKDLAIILKADAHGSIEALADGLMRLSNQEVSVNIVHKGVGAITESDVLLAAASQAIIIGFHVHPHPQARELARREGVEIRTYRIIHEVLEDVRKALE